MDFLFQFNVGSSTISPASEATLTQEEQKAAIKYRLRAGQLTEDRALELAEIPLP